MFFNKKWSDVTDKEFKEMANELKEKMGGWIFHERIDFDKPTPWMEIEKSHPTIMNKWLKTHGGEQ